MYDDNGTKAMISLVNRARARAARILAHIYFCGTLHNDDVKSQNFRFWRQRENAEKNLSFFIFSLKPLVPIYFLGYFAHIVGHERDGIIAKDL